MMCLAGRIPRLGRDETPSGGLLELAQVPSGNELGLCLPGSPGPESFDEHVDEMLDVYVFTRREHVLSAEYLLFEEEGEQRVEEQAGRDLRVDL
jgi:hypothetical protein